MWGEIFAEPAASVTDRHNEGQQSRRFLSAWPKQVPRAAAEVAKAPIQLEEATEVLLKMRKAAAPGPDGLPVGVYVNHWDAIGPDWLAMVEEAELQVLDNAEAAAAAAGSNGAAAAGSNGQQVSSSTGGTYSLMEGAAGNGNGNGNGAGSSSSSSNGASA